MGSSKKKNLVGSSYEDAEVRDKSIEKKQQANFQPKDLMRLIAKAVKKAPEGA